jgi:Uma2 family endonuclease
MGRALRDGNYHTFGDYLAWPDDVRCELIDGAAYLMSPAPGLEHQDVAGEIYRQLANQLRDRTCRVFIAPVDVRLPKGQEADESIDTVVQPDLLVVCDASKLDRRGVRGAPDFVIEVLSPSTASHDQVIKRRVYERAGVEEYWLVHPTDRIVSIYRLVNGEYHKPDIRELSGRTAVDIVPGVSVDWDELADRLPEQDV